MVHLTLEEAQLFRFLGEFFGIDKVIHRISVSVVCGGEFPAKFNSLGQDFYAWTKQRKCQFTIVDEESDPKLVVELAANKSDPIEHSEIQYQRHLKPILRARGVRYVTFSQAEFSEVLNPESNLDFTGLLESKLDFGDTASDDPARTSES